MLLPVAAEAQKRPVSVRAETATVVGDGTNQVVFILEWTGNIPDGSPFEYRIGDPDNAIVYGGDLNPSGVGQVAAPRTGPFKRSYRTRTLAPDDADRVVTFTLWESDGNTVASGQGVATVTVTAPQSLPVVTVAAESDTVFGA